MSATSIVHLNRTPCRCLDAAIAHGVVRSSVGHGEQGTAGTLPLRCDRWLRWTRSWLVASSLGGIARAFTAAVADLGSDLIPSHTACVQVGGPLASSRHAVSAHE